MIRSFKYRLYPTSGQERTLCSWLTSTRELYNAALQERRDAWDKQHIRVTMFEQMTALPEVREVREEFNRIPIIVQRGVLRRLDRAFRAFFRRCKTDEKPGYPRFKSRDRFDSIAIDDVGKTNPIVSGGKRVSVPLLGKIKLKQHRPVEGEIKTVRIKLDGDGHWYVTFACVDVPPHPLPMTEKVVGIDLGLKSLIATSDGDLIGNPRFAQTAAFRLARSQRRLAKKKRGSRRRKEAKRQLRRMYFRIDQTRRQHAIDTANFLVRKYDAIFAENLNVKGMVRGYLSKSISDAGWSTLLQWISVKAESAGREFLKVNPRGTSQKCSSCGATAAKGLAERVHRCACGLVLDRDVNAALNVKALGLSARRAASAIGEQL